MGQRVVPGPGTLRVGRFIGRLGVVSLPAVEAGLDLDQRVVRRHVAKLERRQAGWLVCRGSGGGLRRVADGYGHRVRQARRHTRDQSAAFADHNRARRPRRVVSSPSGTPRPDVEVISRARRRPRAVGGPDALRARLQRPAARPYGLAPELGVARSGDRRERRPRTTRLPRLLRSAGSGAFGRPGRGPVASAPPATSTPAVKDRGAAARPRESGLALTSQAGGAAGCTNRTIWRLGCDPELAVERVLATAGKQAHGRVPSQPPTVIDDGGHGIADEQGRSRLRRETSFDGNRELEVGGRSCLSPPRSSAMRLDGHHRPVGVPG
jgi:hypothetical protein